MSILDEIKAAGINTERWDDIVDFLARFPAPRDRREGYLNLAARALNRVPSLLEIDKVRKAPSP